MILFLEDWNKYPEAVVHLQTRNRSAIKMAVTFKKMGIKNHAFMLALHNPMLADVDPSDPDLDVNTKRLIMQELAINPWYYFREVCRVPTKGSPEPVMFELNRANIAVIFLFFVHITAFLLQPRQTGKSLTMDLLYVYILMYGSRNTDIDVLTKDETIRASNIDRLKGIIDSLPPFLNLRTKKDSFNNFNITVNANNNKLTMHLGQKSPAGAKKVGRGLTSNIVGIDELNFIWNIDITLPTLLSVMTNAAENSKKSGMPYGRIYYSTPGFLDDASGKYGYSLYNSATRWDERYYDRKDEEDLTKFIIDNNGSISPIVLLEYNHLDLGYTDDWLKEKLASTRSDRVTAEADYLMKWPSGSESSVLDPSLIKILNESVKKPLYTEISPQGMIIEWYVTPEEVAQYKVNSFIFALDTSEAIGQDDIGLIGRDPNTGSVICKGKYNKLNLNVFGVFVHWFMITYPESTLIIEKRSSAMGILDHLMVLFMDNNINIFLRVFNWVIEDPEKFRTTHREIQALRGRQLEEFYNEHRSKFGFATSGGGVTSRKELYSKTFIESVKYTGEHTYDRELIGQMVSLEKKNGRVDHALDSHDDLVIAYLLGYWFYTTAKNIAMYGFTPSLVLSNVIINDPTLQSDKDAKDAMNKEKKIIEEINDNLKQLSVAKNEREVWSLTLRIKTLKSKLSTESSLSMNVDHLIKEHTNKQVGPANGPKVNMLNFY